jgi:D-glycero-alpha-D-manno-heptose-7-phosphate kinase
MDYCFEKRDPREIGVVRTPFRVSFFGGGTDYPAYYLRRGGEVLATSITKYAYFMLNRLPEIVEERYRLHYKKYEAVNHIEQIEHPGVRGVLEFLNI